MNFVGYAHPGYVQDLSLDDFRNNMDANYYGQLVPILILLPHFMKERKGHIVNCSSVLGISRDDRVRGLHADQVRHLRPHRIASAAS